VKTKIPELKFPLNQYKQYHYHSLSRSSQRVDFVKSTGTSSGGNKINRKIFLNLNIKNSQKNLISKTSKRNNLNYLNLNNNKIPITSKSKNMNESIRNLKTLAQRIGESCLANDLAALINHKRDMELQKISKLSNENKKEIKTYNKNNLNFNLTKRNDNDNDNDNNHNNDNHNKTNIIIEENYKDKFFIENENQIKNKNLKINSNDLIKQNNLNEENNYINNNYNSERDKLISINKNDNNNNKNLDYIQKLKLNNDIDSDEEFYDELITNINANYPDKNIYSVKNILNKQIRFKNLYNEERDGDRYREINNNNFINNPSNLNVNKSNNNNNELSELKKNFIFSFENPNMENNINYNNNLNNNYNNNFNDSDNEFKKNLYKLREIISNFLLLILKDYSIEELKNMIIDINLLYLILQLPSLQNMRYKFENKVN
jgi:hypothetical protein